MKKKLTAAGLAIGIIILYGCSTESIEDVYNYESTVNEATTQETVTSNDDRTDSIFNHVYGQSAKCIEKGESADITALYYKNHSIDLSVKVEEVHVADNVNQFTQYVSQECVDEYINDNVELIKKYPGLDNNLNDDGSFVKNKMGIDQIAVFVKTIITNNGEEDFEFNSTSFGIYYLKEIDGYYYDAWISDIGNIDQHDEDEFRRNHLTLKPGETREIVMFELIPEQLVTAYTSYIGENYQSLYKDLTIEGTTLDSLYMCYELANESEVHANSARTFRLSIDE